MKKVNDNKIAERNGKYILYRNGRVVVITRDLRIARHAIKNPPTKIGGSGADKLGGNGPYGDTK